MSEQANPRFDVHAAARADPPSAPPHPTADEDWVTDAIFDSYND